MRELAIGRYTGLDDPMQTKKLLAYIVIIEGDSVNYERPPAADNTFQYSR